MYAQDRLRDIWNLELMLYGGCQPPSCITHSGRRARMPAPSMPIPEELLEQQDPEEVVVPEGALVTAIAEYDLDTGETTIEETLIE